MVFVSKGGQYRIKGRLNTNYNFFDIEPPKIGPGGFIAEVLDELNLLVHLQSDQITGFEKAIGSNS